MCLSYLKRVASGHKYETGLEGWALYAALAMGAVSTVAQYNASQAQAEAAKKAAKDNYDNQRNALQEQANQIADAAQNEQNERYRMQMIDEGKIRTASGEAGVVGLSLDRLINDADFQAQMDMQSIQENKANKIKQNDLEGRAAASRYSSAVNQAESGRMTETQTGLQIASGAASTYMLSKSGAASTYMRSKSK